MTGAIASCSPMERAGMIARLGAVRGAGLLPPTGPLTPSGLAGALAAGVRRRAFAPASPDTPEAGS